MTDWGLDLSAVIRKERFSKSNVHWVEILSVLSFDPFCFFDFTRIRFKKFVKNQNLSMVSNSLNVN